MSQTFTHKVTGDTVTLPDSDFDGPLHDDRILDQLLQIDAARQRAQALQALAILQGEQEDTRSAFRTVLAQELEKGMTIVEGRDRTKITEIEYKACSTRGVHINGKWCYGNPLVPVQITR